MAINPNDITTVQVKELPPNPFSGSDNIPHEVGDILSRGTIDEFVAYIRSQAPEARPYECKIIFAPNTTYITDNFDMNPSATQGLGKPDGLWAGWAICNGNNSTENADGQTLIGYGAVYSTILQSLGEKDHTLSVSEIPAHYHHTPGSNFKSFVGGAGDITGNVSSATGGDTGNNTQIGVVNLGTSYDTGGVALEKTIGGGLAHNNMQPSLVVLIIMKLP
jgi:hypothetical protein